MNDFDRSLASAETDLVELCFSVMGAFEENNVLRGSVLTLVGLGLATVGVLGLVDLFTS